MFRKKIFLIIISVVSVCCILVIGLYFAQFRKENNVFLVYGLVDIVDNRYGEFEIISPNEQIATKKLQFQEFVLKDEFGEIKVILSGKPEIFYESIKGKNVLIEGKLISIIEIKGERYPRLAVKKLVKVYE